MNDAPLPGRQWTRRDLLAASALGGLVNGLLSAELLADEKKQRKRTEVAWLKQVQQPPAKPSPKAPPLTKLTPSAATREAALRQWKLARQQIRRKWLSKHLRIWTQKRGPAPQFTVLKEDRPAGVIRQKIRYDVEPGESVEAYLLRPAKPGGMRPGVVAMHSTVDHSILQPAGVQGKPEKAFGLKLAQRGVVTICPRNYLWPTNHKIRARQEAERFLKRRPRSTGMAKMLFDAQVAVDILGSLPEVDTQRLGAVGHSLGAKEALYLAAFDERIRATVSSEGGVGQKFSNWNAAWYLGSQIDKPEFTDRHHEVLALVAPRAFLLIGGDSADGDQSWPYIERVLPVYRLYGEPPRLGLLNHRKGHAVPPIAEKRIYEWLDAYL